jgi:hypothetical protein
VFTREKEIIENVVEKMEKVVKEVVEKIEDVVEVAADNIEETVGEIVEEIEDVVEEVPNKFKDDSAEDDSEGEKEIIEKVVKKIKLIVVPMGWESRAVDDSVPKGWKPRFVKCDVCGKTLARNKDLMQRMRVHEGTKYGCDKCDPGYRRGEEMEKHQRERHEKAGSCK